MSLLVWETVEQMESGGSNFLLMLTDSLETPSPAAAFLKNRPTSGEELQHRAGVFQTCQFKDVWTSIVRILWESKSTHLQATRVEKH